MKTVDSGGLPCAECGSPLVPCRCEREKGRGPRGFNSTLRQNPKKKLRARSLTQRYKDDPLSYGPLFLEVRRGRCYGKKELPGHTCGPGVAPAGAHHVGDTDLDGLLSVCSAAHDDLHDRPWKVTEALARADRPSLPTLARASVVRVMERLMDLGELPREIEEEARRRGLI